MGPLLLKPAPVVRDAAWVAALRYVALAVLMALIVLCLTAPSTAGRVVWTVVIASLPLFIVIAGYHRWRRICPLAFFAQLPARMGRPGVRRAGPSLHAHAYDVIFAVFVGSLWLRLVATNGDGYALGLFLIAIVAAAMTIGAVFTGKTWCNYICPVSFVEKLYTEPRGLRETPNSQCATCTACKPACPDINEENSYWKEILLSSKRRVFYSFPGVVFAFYFYYYLQSGTWEYYFGGRWTDEVGLFRTAFLPGTDAATAGFYFLPVVPRAVAAAATLLAGGIVSLTVLTGLEPRLGAILRRRGRAMDAAGLRHVMFTLAAFIAFVTFYAYAGAPTLRLLPGAPQLFQLLVISTATLALVRRIIRRQTDFAEETLARRIIRTWQWPDLPKPRDLREAFLIHAVRSRSKEAARREVLGLYKSAVRETVNAGMLSRADVHRLEPLRNQLRIADADHERIMAELLEEERGQIADAIRQPSPEKRLQIENYAAALAALLARQDGAGPTELQRLVAEHAVTMEEHAAVLERLQRAGNDVAAHVVALPATIEAAAATIARLAPERSPVARFLSSLLERRWRRAADTLLEAVVPDADNAKLMREGLLSTDETTREAMLAALGSRLSLSVENELVTAARRTRVAFAEATDLAASLRRHLANPDPYVRAAAFFMLDSADAVDDAAFAGLVEDEHPIVRDTVAAASATRAGGIAEPSTLEKMIALRSVGIFEALEPEDLAQVARASTESWFTKGEALCRQGEIGDEVFVLLAGEVSIVRHDAAGDLVIAAEGPGSCIGELAVIDPAPREATVVASTVAVRALRLSGSSFRDALDAHPAASEGILRILARRLRGGTADDSAPSPVAYSQRS